MAKPDKSFYLIYEYTHSQVSKYNNLLGYSIAKTQNMFH